MPIWFWLMLATSPIAFLISFHWTYRWALFDSGGGSKLFWELLHTDFQCSIPGSYGDTARTTRARGWIQKYASMGSACDGMIPDMDKSFAEIVKDGNYQDYAHYFMRPKWWLWSKMLACLIWPFALVAWLVLNVAALLWFLITN